MTPPPAPTAPARPTRGPVSPAVFVAAVLGAVALGVVLAGPLHALLARFVHRPDFAKVYRYLTLGLLVATLVVLLRPWRDVPRDVWGLRGPPGRTVGRVWRSRRGDSCGPRETGQNQCPAAGGHRRPK